MKAIWTFAPDLLQRRCEHRTALTVDNVPRCVTASLYVGGEKVLLGAFSVLALDGVTGAATQITNWKMLSGDTVVTVVPIGMEKHWKHFPSCHWTATTSPERARGNKGRKRGDDGPLGWDGANAIAVAVTRATNSNTASRQALLSAIDTGTMTARDLQAVALSKDATLRLAALAQTGFTQDQLTKLARSTQPHLRMTAAASLRDAKARKALLVDPDPLVRGALARNTWMTVAELQSLERDEHVRLDLAANPATRNEFLTMGVFEGGLFAQIAIMNPRMSAMASALLGSDLPLAGHASGNPGIDVTAAMRAAAGNQHIARGLARNVPALTRISSADAVALTELLAALGDRAGIESVARHATLSDEHQLQLAGNPLISHVVLVGIAGNDAVSNDVAEIVLGTAGIMHPWDALAALAALAGNESVRSHVLNAIDERGSMVVVALKDNESASGQARQKAVEQVRRVRRLHQQLIAESLTKNQAGSPTVNEARAIPALYSPVAKPMAVIVSTPDTVGARIVVQKGSQLAAWGGEVVEVDVRTGGPAVWSEIVLRVNERTARRVQDANPMSDPIGVVVQVGDVERFCLLEPLSSHPGDTWTPAASAFPATRTEGTKDLVLRHAERFATRKKFIDVAMAAVPSPWKAALKTTRQAANATAMVAGEPRGADRVGVIHADLAATPAQLRVLHAETSRRDAVAAGQHHVRLLQASGVLSGHEAATVIGELDLIGQRAATAADRREWAWQAREKLRFTAGQRAVIEQILNGDSTGPDAWTDQGFGGQ